MFGHNILRKACFSRIFFFFSKVVDLVFCLKVRHNQASGLIAIK